MLLAALAAAPAAAAAASDSLADRAALAVARAFCWQASSSLHHFAVHTRHEMLTIAKVAVAGCDNTAPECFLAQVSAVFESASGSRNPGAYHTPCPT